MSLGVQALLLHPRIALSCLFRPPSRADHPQLNGGLVEVAPTPLCWDAPEIVSMVQERWSGERGWGVSHGGGGRVAVGGCGLASSAAGLLADA